MKKSHLAPETCRYLARQVKVLKNLNLSVFTGDADKRPHIDQFLRDFENQTASLNITRDGERAQLIYSFLGQTAKDLYNGFEEDEREYYSKTKIALQRAFGACQSDNLVWAQLDLFTANPGEEPTKVHTRLLQEFGPMLSEMPEKLRQSLVSRHLVKSMPADLRLLAARQQLKSIPSLIVDWWATQMKTVAYDDRMSQSTGGAAHNRFGQQQQQYSRFGQQQQQYSRFGQHQQQQMSGSSAQVNMPASNNAARARQNNDNGPMKCYNCG